MNAPFLILEAGKPVAPMRRHGDFPHWIRVAAGLPRDAAVVVDIEGGEPLPSREGFAGAIVTGSGAMVTERLAWSEATAAWLRDAAHAGLPLFGICYGHQLLAHALGGEVGDNPGGREMGTGEIELLPAAADDPLFELLPAAADDPLFELLPAAADDPLFEVLPARFAAQLTHLQSVLRVPDGAIVLARSAVDPCQAFRWGESAWGVQFHPEFSATHMRGYIQARKVALQREGLDPQAMLAAVGAAPEARRVLRRFVHWSREHARAH